MVVRVTSPDTQIKKVTSTEQTVVKQVVVGAPIRSVIGGLSIAALRDTNIDSVQDDQILIYNASSGKWVNSSSLSPTGVSAGTYGSAIQIPQISVTSSGLIDSAKSIDVATTLATAGDTGSHSLSLLDSSLSIVGTSDISTSVSNNEITISLDSSGVIPNTYGSSTAIPVITVDAKGRLTTVGTAPIATTLAAAADTGSSSISLIDSSLTISGGTNISTSVTDAEVTVSLNDSVDVTGIKAGNIDISSDTLRLTSGSTMVIDPGSLTNTVRIQGNLNVQGTQTTLNSQSLNIGDLNITLADSADSALDADGAGISINGADVNFSYSAAFDYMNLTHALNILDSVSVGLRFNNIPILDTIDIVDGGVF